MKNIKLILLVCFILILSSCKQGGDNSSSTSVDIPSFAPTPKLELLSHSETSYNSRPTYKITNIPVSGGLIYLFDNSNCEKIDNGSGLGGAFSDHGSYLTLDLEFYHTKSYHLSIMTIDSDGDKSSCVPLNYTVLEPPTPSNLTLNSSSPSKLSSIQLTSTVPGYLKLNAYSDSSCTTLIGSDYNVEDRNSLTISEIAVGSYSLYFAMENRDGIKSSCSTESINYTREPLLPPTSLTSTSTSPGNDASIYITASGGDVSNGNTVHLFTDSSCANEIASAVAYGSSVQLNISNITPGSSATYYATVGESISTDSACSSASFIYTRNTINAPSSLSLTSPVSSPYNASSITILVSGVLSGYRVHIYKNANCSGSYASVSTATGTTTSIDVTGLTQVGTPYTFSTKMQDIYGNSSPCSSSTLNYTFIDIATSRITTSGWYPEFIATGDFNGDGNKDFSFTSGFKIETSIGDGAGNFTTGQELNDYDGISSAASIAIGDINKDGYDDIVIGNRSNINYFPSNGDGTFSSPTLMTVPAGTSSFTNEVNKVALADMNGDGNLDVVSANGANSFASILVMNGNGDGTFGTMVFYDAKSMQRDIEVRDINADGFPDVIATQFFNSEIAIFLNDGTGSLGTPTYIASSSSPESVELFDIDNDGDLDLASSGRAGVLNTFLNNGAGTFTASSNINLSSNYNYAFSIESLDYNNDGFQDLIITHENSNQISILLNNNGTGAFVATVWNQSGEANEIAIGDFNNDGLDDFVLTNSIPNQSGEILIKLQN